MLPPGVKCLRRPGYHRPDRLDGPDAPGPTFRGLVENFAPGEEFRVSWNPVRRGGRWEVWHRSRQLGWYVCMIIENPDGSYRMPDGRILQQMKEHFRTRNHEIAAEAFAAECQRLATEEAMKDVSADLREYIDTRIERKATTISMDPAAPKSRWRTQELRPEEYMLPTPQEMLQKAAEGDIAWP